MQITKDYLKNNTAMTLVEILVSIVILGLVLIAIFPLLTQSLDVTNLANQITAQLFADQEDIEIVAATNGGVLFADGTFLTDKQFKVFSDSDPVVGMTVKKSKLIRFLASISRIKATYVYEGYNESEAVIPITGVRTSFIADSTIALVTDREGNDVTSDCEFICGSDSTADEDLQATSAQLTLPTDSDRFTNQQAPYSITLTTGNEQVSTLLPVYLPRGVVAESSGNLRISSNTEDWILKNTSSTITHTINKITFMDLGTSEQADGFVAVGNSGSIYVWRDGEALRRINHNLTTAKLNSVMFCSENKMLVACGDGGIILTSSDGNSWSKSSSNTNKNLNSISYSASNERFVCVGEAGIILTSPNGTTWTQQHTYPRLGKLKNGYKAVEFSGSGDYLQTIYAPVNSDTSRTVIMMSQPKTTNDTLISWGTPGNTVAGGRYTFGIDAEGCLRIEQDNDTFFPNPDVLEHNYETVAPFLTPSPETPAILISRSLSDSASNTTHHHLRMNGNSPRSLSISGAMNTSLYQNTGEEDDDFIYFPAQLGSDPLTRFTGPRSYNGLIAEVMVFNIAVNIDRSDRGDGNLEASDMDLIIKYMSDKYDLGISSINGYTLDKLFYPYTDTNLNTRLDDLPESVQKSVQETVQTGLVLWLDANNDDSLDLDNDEQVLVWQDLVETDEHIKNHAFGAELLSVACSSGKIVAVGKHRNLILSNNSSSWNQSSQIDNKRSAEYKMAKIVCTESDPGNTAETKFVALLNDGLSGFDSSDPSDDWQNGYIAYSDDGSDWTYADLSSSDNYQMNDVFYSTDSDVLLVVGNHGNMFTSTDSGENWNEIDPINFNNLLAGCVR